MVKEKVFKIQMENIAIYCQQVKIAAWSYLCNNLSEISFLKKKVFLLTLDQNNGQTSSRVSICKFKTLNSEAIWESYISHL